MAIKNIGELGLDEITEDYLMAECEDMGAELGVDTNQGSIYRDASDGHIIRAAKFFNDLATVNEILSITTCTGDVLTEKMMERGMARILRQIPQLHIMWNLWELSRRLATL